MSDAPERIWLRWADAEDYASDVEEEDIPAGMECFVRLDIFDARKADNERLRGVLDSAARYMRLELYLTALGDIDAALTATDATTKTADNDAHP